MSSAEHLRQKLQVARLRRLGRVTDLATLQQRLDYLFDGNTPAVSPCGEHQLVFFLPARLDDLVQLLQRKTGPDGWRDFDNFVWAFEDEDGNYTLTLQSARSQCLIVASVISLHREVLATEQRLRDQDIELELD